MKYFLTLSLVSLLGACGHASEQSSAVASKRGVLVPTSFYAFDEPMLITAFFTALGLQCTRQCEGPIAVKRGHEDLETPTFSQKGGYAKVHYLSKRKECL